MRHEVSFKTWNVMPGDCRYQAVYIIVIISTFLQYYDIMIV